MRRADQHHSRCAPPLPAAASTLEAPAANTAARAPEPRPALLPPSRRRHLYNRRRAPTGVVSNEHVNLLFDCARQIVDAVAEGQAIAVRRARIPPLAANDERRAACAEQDARAEDAALEAFSKLGTITDRAFDKGPGRLLTGTAEVANAADGVPAAAATVAAAAAATIAAAAAAPPRQQQIDYNAKAIRTGLFHFSNGLDLGIAKASRQLQNAGPRPVVDDSMVQSKIAPLFPAPVDGDVTPTELERAWRLVQSRNNDVVYTIEAVRVGINSKRSDSAPGMSGLCARVIKQCWHRSSSDQKTHLCSLLDILGNGHVPRTWQRFLYEMHLLKGVALPKPKSDSVRPIGIAEILSNIANTILTKARRPTFMEVCGGNLAIGVRGGQEAMANATRAALKADPSLVAVNLDVRNAFGTASRRILLKELCDRIDDGVLDLIPVLRNTPAMMGSGMSIAFRHTDGGAASIIAFLTGLFQGGPLCAPLCAIVMNALRLRYRQRLVDALGKEAAEKIIDFSFADDTNIIVTVEHLEATLKIITDAIAEGTAGCNMPKTVLYRPRRGDTDHYILCEIADRLGIQTPDKIRYADLPSDRQGITTCGASIGTLEYERRCLQERLEKATGLVDKVLSVVKEAALSERRLPVERSRQAAVLVIRLCAQSRLTYFSRVHDPAVFEPLGRKLDSYVQKAICEILRIRSTDIGLVTAEGPAAEDLKRKILPSYSPCLARWVASASRPSPALTPTPRVWPASPRRPTAFACSCGGSHACLSPKERPTRTR